MPPTPAVLPALLSVLLFTPASSHGAARPEASMALRITPRHIDITSSYHGASLRVEMEAPRHAEVALELRGEPQDAVFNQEGKVGPVWMDVGVVTVRDAPRAYMLFTSAGLHAPSPSGTLGDLKLGYASVEPNIRVEGKGVERAVILREFESFKENRGLYRISEGSLSPGKGAGDVQRFDLEVPLPSTLPPGSYSVALHVFEAGRQVGLLERGLSVRKKGFPLLLFRLAREHAAEYGLLSILVALAAGLFVALLFNLPTRA